MKINALLSKTNAALTPRPYPTPVSRCPAPLRGPVVRSHRAAAPRPCPVAVGREVPIAPPRHGAVRRLASRAPRHAPLATPPSPHSPRRTSRHARVPLRTRITRAARRGHRALPPLHPTIMRRYFAPTSMHHAARPVVPRAVAWSGPVAVGRDARPPGLPARAAAPHGAVRRLASSTR